jgi:hypothetical protein
MQVPERYFIAPFSLRFANTLPKSKSWVANYVRGCSRAPDLVGGGERCGLCASGHVEDHLRYIWLLSHQDRHTCMLRGMRAHAQSLGACTSPCVHACSRVRSLRLTTVGPDRHIVHSKYF